MAMNIPLNSGDRLRWWGAAVTTVGLLIAALAPTQGHGFEGQAASTSHASRTVALYASVGPELTLYDVDIDDATLVKRTSLTLPANVQEAWRHPSKPLLYVAWSTTLPPSTARPATPVGTGPTADRHGVSAFRIDPQSGALHAHGGPASLPARPIHMTVDSDGGHLVLAYNNPSGISVQRLERDGTIGSRVTQPTALDGGIYAHQVRVDRSNNMVVLVTRGNGPTRDKPEDPGALKVFSYRDGVLRNRASIAPGGGFDFQPRHLDFHPSRPWVFVSLERQNKLQVYRKLEDGSLSAAPLFTKDTLADPAGADRPGQALSTVHVHPNGRFVYLANRASGTTEFQGMSVFAGGENSIAVFAVNEDTGEPTLIQNIDTRGFHPRTFALDSSGRILVAANQNRLMVRENETGSVRTIHASLAVYRVRGDGRLEFVRKYDVETAGARNLFWMGLVSLR
jgi:6-phosphogluconolactonase (cycloisomerase 2 family)